MIFQRVDAWKQERSAQACALWAKSGREDAYLTLVQHLADAVSVAEWLWEHWVSDALKAQLSRLWGLEEDEVARLYCFLAGIHDVGKASASFQRLVEHRSGSEYLLGPLIDAGISLEWPQGESAETKFPHGTASALLLRRWLEKTELDLLRRNALASIVDAHHGFTSDPMMVKNLTDATEGRTSIFDDIAYELLDSMAELTEVHEVLEELAWNASPDADALQITTGLVIMADWIASNEDAFCYHLIQPAPERLAKAMEYIALPKPWVPVEIPEGAHDLFRNTFGWPDNFSVRPVQRAAAEVARAATGATLMIIEAPTGEGKTEAGLAAAHILGAKSGAQGVFLAAPTMATANGLFERASQWARRSSRGGEVASMYLAHSKNKLSKQYQALRYSSIAEDEHASGSDSRTARGEVVATQWLSSRNRGILSDFVVGTVDQVLMMALQTRFSMLRHTGLAGKIIIIDEVHAYDAYMSQYLYLTLEWLARYRASVILMSATLPPQQRKRLAAAYASQLIHKPEQAAEAIDLPGYPLISVADASGIRAIEVEAGAADVEIATARIEDSIDALCSTVCSQLSEGGIALIICNTIARAQEAFSALDRQYPGEVELHHSAFLAVQRSEKEDALREALGPAARRGKGRPWRSIVVATQVAEQSLDIDADLLITDIAPVIGRDWHVGRGAGTSA
ncbi:CRISPR-associated helicase Cas3' [Corynebacterium pseudopelargi]|uniref:CRISPR-associated nuclease/helicase Cas3 n=1 Tax=Corynebacterium pseudopelargi TaxID=2080757 RepID=A0A3G6IT77_9CORY|nr:CRISPR-associated helicase Cas3' [Corynebacterium pseudopelargi]AZA08757.1 CRISPR-associated nuclease/helicase Cas3 [Corynebacterium pseudopelargi]